MHPSVLREGRGRTLTMSPSTDFKSGASCPPCGRRQSLQAGVSVIYRICGARGMHPSVLREGRGLPPCDLMRFSSQAGSMKTLEQKVGREGVEPSRCHHRRILSPLRLPIPPSPQASSILSQFTKTRVGNRELRILLTFTILRSLFSIHDFRKTFTTRARME